MHGHCLGEEECVSIDEALRAMTEGGAYMTFEERDKGTLEPGKLADLVLLDRNLAGIHTEQLRDITVRMTIIDGRIVYQAQ